MLYKLDPKTSETFGTLDFVGDEGRAQGNVPTDIATDGGSLWIVNVFQLLP